MKDVYKILALVRQVRGNQKLKILRDNKDNEILKEILEYCYNPHKVYKIKEKSLKKFRRTSSLNKSADWTEFKKYFDHLNNVTGVNDFLLEKIAKFIYNLEGKLSELFLGILCKDLKLGLNVTSLNKVWEDLIPIHSVERLKDYDITTQELPFRRCLISRKWDGLNCCVLKEDGKIKLLSREGKEFRGFDFIKKEAEYLDLNNFVYFGELIWEDENEVESFKNITRCKSPETYKKEENYVNLELFNKVERDVYYNKESAFTSLRKAAQSLEDELNSYPRMYIFQTKQQFVATFEELQSLYDRATRKGWEGLVIKDADGYFSTSRGKYGVRVKTMKSEEFEIVDYTKGTGKYKETLGAIVIQLPSGHDVKVGSGFSDEERDAIYNIIEHILDERPDIVATINYFEKTANKKGEESLRFPVFKGFRRKDTLEEISVQNILKERG